MQAICWSVLWFRFRFADEFLAKDIKNHDHISTKALNKMVKNKSSGKFPTTNTNGIVRFF